MSNPFENSLKRSLSDEKKKESPRSIRIILQKGKVHEPCNSEDIVP